MRAMIGLGAAAALLAACGDYGDAAEDRVERRADASAAASGAAPVAFGLTEAQLLDAELIGPADVELADVVQVVRGPDGTVERVLVEVEDSNPDRYVHVPVQGLSPLRRGADTDLSTALTKAQLDALPTVALPTR